MGNDPDILVDLTTCSSAFEAQVTKESLEAAGIPAFATTTVGAWNPWEIASTMPMRVQVRRRDLPLAHCELENIRAEASTIDWAAQDLGEPEPGEAAALGTGRQDWSEHEKDKRSFANTVLWLASMAAFGSAAALALLGGWIAKVVRNKPD